MRARNANVRHGKPKIIHISDVSRALRFEKSGSAGLIRPQRGSTGRRKGAFQRERVPRGMQPADAPRLLSGFSRQSKHLTENSRVFVSICPLPPGGTQEVTFRKAVPILCRYGYVTFVSDTGHLPSRDVFGPTYKYHAGQVPKCIICLTFTKIVFF